MSLARAACCMLWVTITIVYLLRSSAIRSSTASVAHRVERRAGLVHQQHLRLDGGRASDAEALLLAAGEAGARLVEPVLDLVPEVGAAQGLLDDRLLLGLLHALLVEVEARRDVLVDRHRRERVRRLEDHPDQPPHVDRVDAGAVDVVAVQASRSPSARAPGVSSCMRLSERRNVVLPQPEEPISAVTWFGSDRHVDALDRLEVAVEEVHVANLDGGRPALDLLRRLLALGTKLGELGLRGDAPGCGRFVVGHGRGGRDFRHSSMLSSQRISGSRRPIDGRRDGRSGSGSSR